MMEHFVFEIANYLLRRDEESLMKATHKERRKEERSQILSNYIFDRLSPIEAVQEMFNMDRKLEDRHVIPVRYPESDRPDWVDMVMFRVPQNTPLNTSLLQQNILEFYQQLHLEEADRLTKIERVFDMVANKYSGTWCYLDQDVQPLEVE